MGKNEHQEHEALRRARQIRLSLLLLGVIIVGTALVLVWQGAAHNGSGGGSSGAGAPQSTTAGTSSPLAPPVALTAMYYKSVREQVAQGLHLTVAQVTTQLKAEPAPDLRGVAKPQGLAQDQLYRLVINALQTASAQMVSAVVWTEPQADDEMQYWRQQDTLSLINGVARWFLQQ